MKRALLHPERCRNCQPCPAELACSMHAFFRENRTDKPWVDFYRCGGCMKCKAACGFDAIECVTQPCNGRRKMGW
jgi:Fe-S-cluster-containing hydrogenase component 2